MERHSGSDATSSTCSEMDEDTIGVAKYILENPVRGNLVERLEDYPFLGSMTMEIRELLYSLQIERRT